MAISSGTILQLAARAASFSGKAAVAALALAACVPAARAAQPWPDRPVRIIVSQSPGGASDMQTRMIAEPLSRVLGQPVVVENRPGATGLIGAEAAAVAAPDGYTLLIFQDVNTIFPSVMKSIHHDPAKSFAPITLIGRGPGVLVAHPSFDQDTLQGLVREAKAHPNKLSYATPGVGTIQHLSGEIFQRTAGIKMTAIPYKGGGQAIADAVSGQVPLAMMGVPPVRPHIAAGKLKALAVTGTERSRFLPDVPTFKELGYPGVEEIYQWQGVVAPAGTPPEIIQRLHDEIVKIMERPEILEKMQTMGLEPITSPTPQDFAGLIRAELKRWPEVAKAAGIEPQ